MKIFLQKKYENNKKGFVILFAMLVSSLMLLISGGVYNLVQKQLVLSSYARESQIAFYAADSALDCALFYDNSPLLTEGSFFPIDATAPYQSPEMDCGDGTTSASLLNVARTGFIGYTSSFVFRYSSDRSELLTDQSTRIRIDSGCAYVLVEKIGLAPDPILTRITATGFNTCIGSGSGYSDAPDTNDPRLLERRISISYTSV